MTKEYKLTILLAVIFLLGLISAILRNNSQKVSQQKSITPTLTSTQCQSDQGETRELVLENKKYCLLVADIAAEWEKGLMYYRVKPAGVDGMIFIFPNKKIQTFWNKNTYLDLKIYWMDDEKIVAKVELPSINKTKNVYSVTSPAIVNKVIEIIIMKSS